MYNKPPQKLVALKQQPFISSQFCIKGWDHNSAIRAAGLCSLRWQLGSPLGLQSSAGWRIQNGLTHMSGVSVGLPGPLILKEASSGFLPYGSKEWKQSCKTAEGLRLELAEGPHCCSCCHIVSPNAVWAAAQGCEFKEDSWGSCGGNHPQPCPITNLRNSGLHRKRFSPEGWGGEECPFGSREMEVIWCQPSSHTKFCSLSTQLPSKAQISDFMSPTYNFQKEYIKDGPSKWWKSKCFKRPLGNHARSPCKCGVRWVVPLYG